MFDNSSNGSHFQRAIGEELEPPLCVDLDGTVLRTDLLFECLASLLRTKPLYLLLVPVWLLRGRAYLKNKLAEAGVINVNSLPYNAELLSWLSGERSRGRQVILTTAAAKPLAQAVSNHLNIFDFVIASSDRLNVKSQSKLNAIRQSVGDRFDYVGDSDSDGPLFAASRQAIWVRRPLAGLRTRKLDRAKLEFRFFPLRPNRLSCLMSEMRVHQWAKNLLIFIPLAAAHQVSNPVLLLKATLCFLFFSLVASSTYIINDIVDIEADRNHVQKKYRPLAAGTLSIRAAFVLAPFLFSTGIFGAFLLGRSCAAVILGYFLLTLFYTFLIKKCVFYDVLTLAILYVFRLFAGQESYHVAVSTWLVSCCFFLFQSLALCKRASELSNAEGSQKNMLRRRDYWPSDLTVVSSFGIGSGMLASLVTVLYVESENVRKLYHRPEILWLLSPLILQWVARTWILAHRGLINEDPVLFSLKDKATWITLVAGVAVILTASLRF